MKLRDFIENSDPSQRPVGKLQYPWNQQIKNRDPRLPPIPKVSRMNKIIFWARGLQPIHRWMLFFTSGMGLVVSVSILNGVKKTIDNIQNPTPSKPWEFVSWQEAKIRYDDKVRAREEQRAKLKK